MKILIVCLGNICRSPLAEGILKSKLESKMPDVFIDSAGTGGWHAGEPPDPRSVSIAKKYQVDISLLKARKFNVDDFEKFDLILVMDHSNYKDLQKLGSSSIEMEKVHLLLEFSGQTELKEVPDPYYGGTKEFDHVFQVLEKACDRIAAKMLTDKGKA